MANSVVKKPEVWAGILKWDSALNGFPVSVIPRSGSGQCTFVGRNTNTGAIYAVWFANGNNTFRVGAVISGSAPNQGEEISISYPI